MDHVGHIGGRNSVLMASKLVEMDEVVKTIHTKTLQNLENNQEKTLLVVVSDHGMTENGNHGGSSYEETDSIVLFIGPKTHASDHSSSNHDTIFQVSSLSVYACLIVRRMKQVMLWHILISAFIKHIICCNTEAM